MPLPPEQKSRLSSHECVTYWTDRYPQRATEVLRAVELLSDDTDVNTEEQACAAIASAASAICDGVKIFVSYKLGHGTAAKALLEPIELFGSGRIMVDESSEFPFLCERAGMQGTDYKQVIHKALEETHWFFLLLPEESVDRSWTMFEAGFFRRAMHPGDRLICIHHSTIAPAGPLEDFDRVTATPEEIMRLFRRLLYQPGAVPGMNAINSRLREEDLQPYVDKLAGLIRPRRKVKRRYYATYIDLVLDPYDQITGINDLVAARVIAGFRVDRLFGAGTELEKPIQDESDLLGRNQTQGQTLDSLLAHLGSRPEQCEWVKELAEAIKVATEGGEPHVIDTVMRGYDDRFYRPVLHNIRRFVDNNEPISAHIAFYEVLTGPIRRAPRPLDALATALRISYRLRWEVIEEFAHINDEAEVKRVERILRRVEREAIQRSIYRPHATDVSQIRNTPLIQAFVVPADQESVIQMQLEWQKYRNREGTGKLDLAFRSSDPDAVATCLSELRLLNSRFMRMAARRYAELVSEHWPDTS